jgi:hypothetical protein
MIDYQLTKDGQRELELFKNNLAKAITFATAFMPDNTREKSLFLTKMEEAGFYGSRAIASKVGNYEATVSYPRELK